MTEKLENGLFIFRRDLRIIDNNGLNLLSTMAKNIYTIFIFTPEQVGSGNKYKSDNSVQFMIQSLHDLSSQISKAGGHLYTFYGHNDSVIEACIKAWDINIVCYNVDVTSYAKERDEKIVKLCERLKTYVVYAHDYYLHQPGTVLNGSGEIYKKFTPYYTAAQKKKVDAPSNAKKIHFKRSEAHIANKLALDSALKKFVGKENPDILVHGGRSEAIKQMRIAAKNIAHYSKTRDELSKPTSQLSAFIKFGCVSIREVYKAFRSNHSFIRQLYWRDFYAGVVYGYPRVLGHSLNEKYDKIRWHHNERWFDAWKKGETGIPIVDSGMRQLNTCGYMHNRTRLIVASFLVKTMLIDWQKGEQYFASKLTDYDVASNNGNWQWISGGGADSQQYTRIFNPWTQQENFDPKCEYIKTWLPELKDVEPKIIHNWETEWKNHKDVKYTKPILDYSEQRKKTLDMYSQALY
jgi:deoxyribodipyrimidine photo-lyase